MDEESFKKRVSRLNEVAKVIESLPIEIRALSFPLLEDYVTGNVGASEVLGSGKKLSAPPKAKNCTSKSRDEFLASFDHAKPSDNVYLLIAALYRDYGSEPFTIRELSSLASDTGVTIPERIDMTLKAATHQGKKLFVGSGIRGYYKPTVHGEQYLKETYEITKGTDKKPVA